VAAQLDLGVSPVALDGGGSVPGTPPSLTCSVHSDPDQYRFSCRPVGSISQPGAMPVNATCPEGASTGLEVRSVVAVSANERVGADAFERPLRR
jgi:hypothetical protein